MRDIIISANKENVDCWGN